MNKYLLVLFSGMIALSLSLTGCSQSAKDEEKINDAQEGNVVEVEGSEDQYGWMPQLRLTYDGDTIKEVYFDYINGDAAKKSQDEEYNANMESKTGINVKDTMENLRQQLIEKQDPEQVEVVTGATQTSTEFIEMAKKAVENYKNGKNSANNYGEEQNQSDASNTDAQNKAYTNGGDGNPNQQESSSSEGDSNPPTDEAVPGYSN